MDKDMDIDLEGFDQDTDLLDYILGPDYEDLEMGELGSKTLPEIDSSESSFDCTLQTQDGLQPLPLETQRLVGAALCSVDMKSAKSGGRRKQAITVREDMSAKAYKKKCAEKPLYQLDGSDPNLSEKERARILKAKKTKAYHQLQKTKLSVLSTATEEWQNAYLKEKEEHDITKKKLEDLENEVKNCHLH